jgi:hypothetical protein
MSLDLDAIRARSAGVSDRPLRALLVNVLAVSGDPASKADTRFLSSCRQDIADLLAEVDRLRAANANLTRNAEVLADELVHASAAAGLAADR